MTEATIPFAVRNRWSGEVQFTAQIACAPDEWPSVKLGLAVRWARKSRADLSGAVLRSFKADFWLTLAAAQAEIPDLIAALRDGQINGSAYTGECACLVGTIANVRGVSAYSLDYGSGRPAEQWFAMIKPGDKPGDDSGGGFASQQALDWTLEFCRAFGIDPDGGAAPAEAA